MNVKLMCRKNKITSEQPNRLHFPYDFEVNILVNFVGLINS